MPYNMGEYYERVNDYDLEYQSQTQQDVPFWCELVMRYTPERVLELACGSGRIGIELLHSPGNFQLEGRTGASWNASQKQFKSVSHYMKLICVIINSNIKGNLTSSFCRLTLSHTCMK